MWIDAASTCTVDGRQPNMATRTWPSIVIASLMIVFGLAEIVTAFRHAFFGLTTMETTASTLTGAGLGTIYAVSGVLLLTMRKPALLVAAALLALDVAGRVAMVATGMFPLSSSMQIVGIVGGTLIAALFTVYVVWKWRALPSL
jgi:hypothetical protein